MNPGFSVDSLVKAMLVPEPNAQHYLDSLRVAVDSQLGIINFLGEETDYLSDEPRFLAFRAEVARTNMMSDGGYIVGPAEGGRSHDPMSAEVGGLFEGLERYSLSIYRQSNLVFNTYNDLISDGQAAIDPCRFSSAEKVIQEEQRSKVRNSQMYWTNVWSLRLQHLVYIPAQLVYLPYKYSPGELVLRDPLTTGTAAGLTIGKSILRGLLEVLERDVTMTTYYLKIPGRVLRKESLRQDSILTKMLSSLERYNIECTLYECSLDIPVPVVVCRLIDRSGVGPAVTLGSKASFNLVDAARGAILEAAVFRRPMRKRMQVARKKTGEYLEGIASIDSGEMRAYVSIQPEVIEELHYLDAEDPGSVPDLYNTLCEEQLSDLINRTLKHGDDLLICDVTSSDVATLGVCVTKVIVPGLQPMHLSEENRCFTKRLLHYGLETGACRSVGDLNPVPHPFL